MKSKSQYILLRNDKKIYSSHAAAKETLDRYEPEYRSKYKVVKIEEVQMQEDLFKASNNSITLTPLEFGQAIHAALEHILKVRNEVPSRKN